MAVVNLFAGLTEISSTRFKNGVQAQKMVIDVKAPTLLVNLDEAVIAGGYAVQLVEQIRENILAGAKFDGTQAQPLAASTVERREYRLAQGARGGALSPVRVNKKKRATGRKNWRKRFRTPRLGEFNPATGLQPTNVRGVESGLLLKSMVAERQGDSWRIFFANNRALTDRTGQSPVGRAFGYTPGDRSAWERAVKQPSMRKRLQHVLQASIGGKPGNFLRELEKTARLAESIASEAEG